MVLKIWLLYRPSGDNYNEPKRGVSFACGFSIKIFSINTISYKHNIIYKTVTMLQLGAFH